MNSRGFALALIGVAVLTEVCASGVPAGNLARVADVSEARLRADVTTLTAIGSGIAVQREGKARRLVPGNPRSQEDKIAYLRSQLEPLGYAIEIETFALPARFQVSANFQGRNLIATKRGTTEPTRVLELGAHHDTMATAGADDNSSGVAGVLEVARVLARGPTAKSIRFCFLDFEELGMLGSAEHVMHIKNAPEAFEGILVFEMIGYAVDAEHTQRTPVRIPGLIDPPTTGDFISVVGNMRSGNLGAAFERAADRLTPPLRYFSLNRLAGFIKDAARSDQSSYWAAGLPGVMLTDTANFRNPHYHRATDTIETLNFAFMTQVVRAATRCLLERAGAAGADRE